MITFKSGNLLDDDADVLTIPVTAFDGIDMDVRIYGEPA